MFQMVAEIGFRCCISAPIEAVWRIESARLIAALTRMVGDIGLAEDLAQDALVAALEQWPESGIPRNPGAWLMATAKHRAIDLFRRNQRLERKHTELGYELLSRQAQDWQASEAALDDPVGDDLLRLIFMTCHPVLSTEARVALTLRLLGGLTTEEIARAFLVPVPTVAQRIVRARRTLTEAHVPFEVPQQAELAARLASVLEVIYLIFNEGYAATAGDDWMRPALCEDALRLGRILAELAPQEAGGPRPGRADGDPGFALAGALGPAGPAGLAFRSEQNALGSHPHRSRACRPRSGLSSWAKRSVRTRFKPPSLPVTPGRAPRRRPIGCASWRSTMRSPSLLLRRLWS